MSLSGCSRQTATSLVACPVSTRRAVIRRDELARSSLHCQAARHLFFAILFLEYTGRQRTFQVNSGGLCEARQKGGARG